MILCFSMKKDTEFLLKLNQFKVFSSWNLNEFFYLKFSKKTLSYGINKYREVFRIVRLTCHWISSSVKFPTKHLLLAKWIDYFKDFVENIVWIGRHKKDRTLWECGRAELVLVTCSCASLYVHIALYVCMWCVRLISRHSQEITQWTHSYVWLFDCVHVCLLSVCWKCLPKIPTDRITSV